MMPWGGSRLAKIAQNSSILTWAQRTAIINPQKFTAKSVIQASDSKVSRMGCRSSRAGCIESVSQRSVSMRTIRRSVVKTVLAAVAFVAFPVMGYAQQATISGTVTDAAGKAIANVQIVATHVESGEKVNTVTDSNGGYRIPVRVGPYEILFTASGFAAVNRTGVSLLLGQQGIVNVQLTPSSEARTITVTGEVELTNAG